MYWIRGFFIQLFFHSISHTVNFKCITFRRFSLASIINWIIQLFFFINSIDPCFQFIHGGGECSNSRPFVDVSVSTYHSDLDTLVFCKSSGKLTGTVIITHRQSEYKDPLCPQITVLRLPRYYIWILRVPLVEIKIIAIFFLFK